MPTEDPGRRVPWLSAGQAQDSDTNRLLEEATTGWWQDPRMWGVIGHVPGALTHWVQLIYSVGVEVDPVAWELMALRGAFVTGCHY